jgi:hypothetical protein
MGSYFPSSIPNEILVNALLYLLPVDLHSVSRVNRHLRTLVLSSPTLQSHVLLRESGYEDTLCSNEPLSHRVAALKRDKKHWGDCKFVEAAATDFHLADELREPTGLLKTSLKQGLYVLYRDCHYIRDPTEGLGDDLHILEIERQCVDCACGEREGDGVKLTYARRFRFDPMRRGLCFDRDRHDLLAVVTLETNV